MFSAVIGKIGVTELLVILLIVLVVFGPTQLPKLSKTLGKTISSFKKGMEDELSKDDKEESKTEKENNVD
jgi:sec-independent protein translocase protein TatA